MSSIRLLSCCVLHALLAGVIAGSALSASALADPDPDVEVRPEDHALTDAVIVASSELQKGEPSARPPAAARLAQAAKRRQARMSKLMEEHPKQFLKLALPKELRDSMPASVQGDIEYETELEGTAYVLHEDRRTGSRYLYFLQGAEGEVALHFADTPPVLETGTRIKVKGTKLNRALVAGVGTGDVQTLAATAPLISGAQATAVIMVNFTDKPSSYTPSQIRQVVFTTTSDFHKENSYQQAWLSGDVYGPYTIAMSSGACDYNGLATRARSAASAAGVSLSAFKRFVYVFPQNACGWWGLGTIGGNPSHSWINGTVVVDVVGHEIGHNYGLYHSHALECGSVTIGSSCSNIEYGDTLDIMGNTRGHYNAYQKERLGWLNTIGTPPLITASAGGQYLIDVYETTGTAAKALKILKSTNSSGQKTWYYVEYRQPLGFDGFISGNSNVQNGVVIHTGAESSPDTSYLLDMTPGTSSWNDPALGVSKTYQDQQAGISINVAWLTGTTAAVNVATGSQTCVRSKPTVSISPASGVVTQAGKTASYTVSISNADNSACTASNFSVVPGPPTGWAATVTSPLTINPGATLTTPLQITSPASTGEGSYNIPVTVTNNTDSAQSTTASAKYLVATVCSYAKPTLTISPLQSVPLKPGTPVPYVLTVMNNDSSACPATNFSFSNGYKYAWSFSYAPGTLTIAPGVSATSTLTLKSPTSKYYYSNGLNSFNVTVTRKVRYSSYSSKVSAGYVIDNTATR